MTQEPKSERDLDARLDEALEMTFPASDPIAVHSPDAAPRPEFPGKTLSPSSALGSTAAAYKSS
jgi:hypothetical protein